MGACLRQRRLRGSAWVFGIRWPWKTSLTLDPKRLNVGPEDNGDVIWAVGAESTKALR